MPSAEPPRLEQLLPPGPALGAAEAIEGFGLWQRPAGTGTRPRILLNMVASVDGRATLDGRSGGLSGPADRALFHWLRAVADGVLVGAGTARKERYGRLITDAGVRRTRREHALREEPVACIATRSLDLDASIPLLADPSAEVVVLTPAPGEIAAVPAKVRYVRCGEGAGEDLAWAMRQLREQCGIELLLCEGGPHLARDLIADGLLDELYLSVSPLLEGGDGGQGPCLRILAGGALDPPAELELVGVLRSSSTLFLRYAVLSGARVARETTVRSSLAS